MVWFRIYYWWLKVHSSTYGSEFYSLGLKVSHQHLWFRSLQLGIESSLTAPLCQGFTAGGWEFTINTYGSLTAPLCQGFTAGTSTLMVQVFTAGDWKFTDSTFVSELWVQSALSAPIDHVLQLDVENAPTTPMVRVFTAGVWKCTYNTYMYVLDFYSLGIESGSIVHFYQVLQ